MTISNSDFLAFYPQFSGNIDSSILTEFVNLANATVTPQRWQNAWKIGICLFIAHFCTLYLQSLGGTSPTATQVVSAGQARGLLSSKSVGDVSAGYDYSAIASDLNGWAMWKATIYGQQFATMAKSLVKAGTYIW